MNAQLYTQCNRPGENLAVICVQSTVPASKVHALQGVYSQPTFLGMNAKVFDSFNGGPPFVLGRVNDDHLRLTLNLPLPFALTQGFAWRFACKLERVVRTCYDVRLGHTS